MENNYQDDILLCQAVKKFDQELKKCNISPFELNVCGGFALLLHQIRKNGDAYTDIDYIGEALPDEVRSISEKVGMEFGFSKDWINNDILLEGSSLGELEYATGKLHFRPKMKLSVITVNALDKKDLLKLKVIAIDTSLMGVEFGGQFTRVKDFKDISLLMKDLHFPFEDVERLTRPFITDDFAYVMLQKYLALETMPKVNPDIEIIKFIKKNIQRRQNNFPFDMEDFRL